MNTLSRRIHEFNWDGAVTFKVEDAGRGSVWLIATNGESNLRWFEKHIFVMALIGPRGGIQIKAIDGLKKRWLM